LPLFVVMIRVMAVTHQARHRRTAKIWSAAHTGIISARRLGSSAARNGQSPEQKRFVEAEPLTDAARKHTTSDLEQHFTNTEANVGR
jgi:hypothetical protein